jgi:hypothetical protein
MAKIILKMSVMFVCLSISVISIAGCDGIAVHYGFIVIGMLVIVPLAIIVWLCRKGWFDDVLEFTEHIEDMMLGTE